MRQRLHRHSEPELVDSVTFFLLNLFFKFLNCLLTKHVSKQNEIKEDKSMRGRCAYTMNIDDHRKIYIWRIVNCIFSFKPRSVCHKDIYISELR